MEGKEQEPTIEELISKIELMKQALMFYGAENNHRTGAIKKDEGYQARFALSQLDIIEDYNDSIKSALEEIEDYENNPITTEGLSDEFQSKLSDINKIIEKYSKNK